MDKEKKNKVINFKNFIKSKKNNKNFNNNNNIVKNTNDDLLINEERKGNLKEKGQNNINSETKRLSNKSKRILIISAISIILIIILILVIVYLANENAREFMDKYLFGKNISEENAEVIEMENENGTRVVGNGKLLGVLENNILKQYNVNAKMESELNVEINNPISDYKDRYLVIGQKGGNKAYLIKGNISQVSVNKNGYTSITLTGAYRTMVDVYDAGGNKLTRIYLANTIAVDTSISSDNKYLAFAEISTSSTSTKSNIKIL